MIIGLEEKIIAGIVAMLIAFGLGAYLEYRHEQGEITKLELAQATALGKSQAALIAANDRNVALSVKAGLAISAAATTYEKGRQDEKAQSDPVIAALRDGTRRLPVRTDRPAGGCPLPGAAPAAPGRDDAPPETLAGPVAARLAQRYADYNEVVDQLTLAQATIKSYQTINEPPP